MFPTTFNPGDTVLFTPYTSQESEGEEQKLREHVGQIATILHVLGPEDVDPEVGTMYHVRFLDNQEFDVFADEVTLLILDAAPLAI